MTQKAPAIKIKNNALKDTRGDKIFFAINAFILGLLALIILYPLYFIVIASFSDPDAVLGGQVVLAPVNITFEGYEKVFQRGDIWQGYLNTIIYTVVTVILSLVVTIPAGWGLSRKTTPGLGGDPAGNPERLEPVHEQDVLRIIHTGRHA